MKRLSKVLAKSGDGSFWFWCPACQKAVRLFGWEFDGNVEAPTFSPSALSTTTNMGGRLPIVQNVCHSFIRSGKIEFLSDCTHELKGQTVDLPELPDWLVAEE